MTGSRPVPCSPGRDRSVLAADHRRPHPADMTKGRALFALALVCGVASVVWVGSQLLGPGSAAALWRLAPGAAIGADVTRIDVLVSRVGCNSGVTGDVLEPDIRESPDEVVVTFRVSPGEPAEADCPDNAAEPYTLVLDDPLGQRRLVDGGCLGGAAAAGTSECKDGGVRATP